MLYNETSEVINVNCYETMQNVINYCENNLYNEITMNELSEMSGYSIYHFCRLFQKVIGCGPMEYIRKRRLSNAAIEISFGHRYIKDIGFTWGFNSHENFVRAFKNQFGISPIQYRETKNSLNLFHKFDVIKEHSFENFGISPRFVSKPSFKLAGFRCRTSFHNNANKIDAPQHWNKYHACKLYDKIGKKIDPALRWDIGMLTDHDANSGDISYVIGVQVDDFNDINDECVRITIPSAQYAVFNTPPADSDSFVKAIHKTWEYIYQVWFPQTGFERMKTQEFETYCEASHSYSEEIWIPIGR
ncbi:MAG: AraC family transcriptional regulator [Herbinix sp.]|nr:AraC family transcriptional regulator [Herbinix sp.]